MIKETIMMKMWKNLKLVREKKIYIGDIAASYEIISSRSKRESFVVAFDKVWIHGLLHWIGYDHIKNQDYYIMDKIEKTILNSIWIFYLIINFLLYFLHLFYLAQ